MISSPDVTRVLAPVAIRSPISAAAATRLPSRARRGKNLLNSKILLTEDRCRIFRFSSPLSHVRSGLYDDSPCGWSSAEMDGKCILQTLTPDDPGYNIRHNTRPKSTDRKAADVRISPIEHCSSPYSVWSTEIPVRPLFSCDEYYTLVIVIPVIR
jgi:hypothetical protein